jgi:hypothetical protein
MNSRTRGRQIHRTPGRLVVIALVCLYGVPSCLLVGAIFEANLGNGEPFFGLEGLFGAIWFPFILLAIVAHLVGPAPPGNPDSAPAEAPEE